MPALLPTTTLGKEAGEVARGTLRLLAALGFHGVREFTLANGRRADIAAIDGGGRLLMVEIKVSLADFRADRKWPDYLDYCDALAFAIPPGLARAPFEQAAAAPETTGLIVADRFGGSLLRAPAWSRLHASRRKAVTVRLALVAAARLQVLHDPDCAGMP